MKMNNKKNINFLHINCQSISNNLKSTRIENLASKHNVDFLSLNETFLKPSKQIEFKDYFFIRADRLIGKRKWAYFRNNNGDTQHVCTQRPVTNLST